MKKALLFTIFLIAAFAAKAQTDFQVERDTAGQFLLIQDGAKTVFDTAFVANSLVTKTKEESAIKAEIELLERLILLRRQLAVVSDERKTLNDILKKSRNANYAKP